MMPERNILGRCTSYFDLFVINLKGGLSSSVDNKITYIFMQRAAGYSVKGRKRL